MWQQGKKAICHGYSIATALRNPSFLGWVVERDFLHQIRAALRDSIYLAKALGVTDEKGCSQDWKVNHKDDFDRVSDLKQHDVK
eukprot:333543-Amorphochlora_amoeboformis.AAC.1